MALIFTNSTSSGIVVTSSGDTWVTRENRYVANDGDAFRFQNFDNLEYFIQGDVFATDDGVTALSGAVNLSIAVGLGGSINAAGDGIELLTDSTSAAGHRVTNDGSIIGEAGSGVDIRGANNKITNNGFISGSSTAAFIQGGNGSIFNNGSIVGDTGGAQINGDNAEIFNHGSIIAGADGLNITGDNAKLVNTGDVTGGSEGITLFGTGTIINHGTVTGFFDGIRVSNSVGEASTTVNTGTVSVIDQQPGRHAFDGGLGDETVINKGMMTGGVDLSSGNDMYKGALGVLEGDVTGGNGNDTIIGGAADDRFFGDNDDDSILGNGGDDTLDGGAGADLVRGGAGDDRIVGGGSADELYGGRGDDTILGNNGADTIYGGRGQDVMTGGSKADVFVFGRGAGSDIITDFDNGDDLIDVSAFGLNGFGDLAGAVSQSGGDTIIDWSAVGGTGQLILEDITGIINGADFIF